MAIVHLYNFPDISVFSFLYAHDVLLTSFTTSTPQPLFFLSTHTSSFPGLADVWFSLSGTTYQNNSIVTLENIGDNSDNALLCETNLTACCKPPFSKTALGNWFFPNGTRVPSKMDNVNGTFSRTRKKMGVRMHHRRGGEDGIYRCEIPDSTNITQTIYIGVYNTSTGE